MKLFDHPLASDVILKLCEMSMRLTETRSSLGQRQETEQNRELIERVLQGLRDAEPKAMTKTELEAKIREILPLADFGRDLNEQVIIYTGLEEHADSDELTELEL